MKNTTLLCSTLLITLLIFIEFACTADRNSGSQMNLEDNHTEIEEIPLIYHMSFISRYAQKLYFAGDAENWELADIYSHEIEEISAHIVSRGEVSMH